MISQDEFIEALGNPETEDEVQISIGLWLADQIGHTPTEISYRCLAHHNGISYCAYADKGVMLGMTFAAIEAKEVLIAPVNPETTNEERIAHTIRGMKMFAGMESYETAAICRDLLSFLGVEAKT